MSCSLRIAGEVCQAHQAAATLTIATLRCTLNTTNKHLTQTGMVTNFTTQEVQMFTFSYVLVI